MHLSPRTSLFLSSCIAWELFLTLILYIRLHIGAINAYKPSQTCATWIKNVWYKRPLIGSSSRSMLMQSRIGGMLPTIFEYSPTFSSVPKIIQTIRYHSAKLLDVYMCQVEYNIQPSNQSFQRARTSFVYLLVKTASTIHTSESLWI